MLDRMERFPGALTALLAGLPEPDARWKPSPSDWSILEIVRHLEDEEREDFSVRVRMTLEEPASPWPPIDPEGTAIARRYNEGSLPAALDGFAAARAASLRWLRSLEAADWSRAHPHPRWGPVPAGLLMTSWCAHDALHLRQLARRHLQLAERDGGGHETIYAGAW